MPYLFFYHCLNGQHGNTPILWQLCYHGNSVKLTIFKQSLGNTITSLSALSLLICYCGWMNLRGFMQDQTLQHVLSQYNQTRPPSRCLTAATGMSGLVDGQYHFQQGYKPPHFSTVCVAAVGNAETFSYLQQVFAWQLHIWPLGGAYFGDIQMTKKISIVW